MSTTVSALRAGLASNLSTVTGAQISSYQLSNPTTPAFSIFPAGTEYNLAANRGLDRWTFTVQAIVSAAMDQNGQAQLDSYLAPTGSTSVRAALESDLTLGGSAQTLVVTGVSGYVLYADAQPPALGAEWTVDVWCSGQ